MCSQHRTGMHRRQESVVVVCLDSGACLPAWVQILPLHLTVLVWARAQRGMLTARLQACGEDEV